MIATWLLRAAGLLILLLALGVGLSRAPERPVQSLVPRWAPPPSEFIDLDGQLVHLRDQGPKTDTTPIVLIHGTSASLHTWEGWVRELQPTRRVISFDLPGFGLTGPNDSGDYSDPAYVRFVLALMDRLKLKQVVIGGNSLGGEIAWQVAASAPARVKALVLVDAGGYDFQPESIPLSFQLARLPGARYLIKGILPRRLVEQSVRNVYGDPSKVGSELVDRYFEMAVREGNREALTQRMAQLEPGRYAQQVPTLKQPTLILWGGRDRLIPLSNGQRFAREIAGSELKVFDALGHVPQEEDPAQTVLAVKAFLARL
ncbi:alpha/beta fold hydrolase [Roseateles toxinivorans]|uniref:Pimeloyl-ACP methyl ester carboxylesterase n=1 Tax=Roseateles toxinivorans TaxID=270368 RepID=A0A4R6QK70_9BURK|nr:alpha/beta hydrolase [Roseateles toxinivorans]TDP63032.1 pimeloyl-ACP methyl ester carboxylesterase [Roseateles toxinivorans]